MAHLLQLCALDTVLDQMYMHVFLDKQPLKRCLDHICCSTTYSEKAIQTLMHLVLN